MVSLDLYDFIVLTYVPSYNQLILFVGANKPKKNLTANIIPTFNVVKQRTSSRVVIVLDVSGSMVRFNHL
jgi:hypothetical protein